MGLGIGSIGGKDSMSGTFEDLDVPPTLISFAVTMGKTDNIVSPEFKEAGHRVVLLKPYTDEDGDGAGKGLPRADSLIRLWDKAAELILSGRAVAAYTPGIGGVAEAVMKMSFGNGIGFSFETMDLEDIFGYCYGGIILEVTARRAARTVSGQARDGVPDTGSGHDRSGQQCGIQGAQLAYAGIQARGA